MDDNFITTLLNNPIYIFTYTGEESETATVIVDNDKKTIRVDVKSGGSVDTTEIKDIKDKVTTLENKVGDLETRVEKLESGETGGIFYDDLDSPMIIPAHIDEGDKDIDDLSKENKELFYEYKD